MATITDSNKQSKILCLFGCGCALTLYSSFLNIIHLSIWMRNIFSTKNDKISIDSIQIYRIWTSSWERLIWDKNMCSGLIVGSYLCDFVLNYKKLIIKSFKWENYFTDSLKQNVPICHKKYSKFVEVGFKLLCAFHRWRMTLINFQTL